MTIALYVVGYLIIGLLFVKAVTWDDPIKLDEDMSVELTVLGLAIVFWPLGIVICIGCLIIRFLKWDTKASVETRRAARKVKKIQTELNKEK